MTGDRGRGIVGVRVDVSGCPPGHGGDDRDGAWPPASPAPCWWRPGACCPPWSSRSWRSGCGAEFTPGKVWSAAAVGDRAGAADRPARPGSGPAAGGHPGCRPALPGHRFGRGPRCLAARPPAATPGTRRPEPVARSPRSRRRSGPPRRPSCTSTRVFAHQQLRPPAPHGSNVLLRDRLNGDERIHDRGDDCGAVRCRDDQAQPGWPVTDLVSPSPARRAHQRACRRPGAPADAGITATACRDPLPLLALSRLRAGAGGGRGRQRPRVRLGSRPGPPGGARSTRRRRCRRPARGGLPGRGQGPGR
jgi:hypothetical protein